MFGDSFASLPTMHAAEATGAAASAVVTPGAQSYEERHRATYRLGSSLAEEYLASLLAFPEREPAQNRLRLDELRALKNNVADALIAQKRWMTDPRQANACKIAALQVLGTVDPETGRGRALAAIGDSASPLMLKVSALATLGVCGVAEDLPAVQRFADSPDYSLRTAADDAGQG